MRARFVLPLIPAVLLPSPVSADPFCVSVAVQSPTGVPAVAVECFDVPIGIHCQLVRVTGVLVVADVVVCTPR